MKTKNLASVARVVTLGLLGALLAAACGDDAATDGEQAEPASDELIAACVGYFTKVDGFAEANGCTRIDAAALCEQLHPNNGCESEFRAEYACVESAVTAEDCQCEAEGGGPLCNEAVAACAAEGDASLACANEGG